jgi:hypothetical protein
MGKLYIIRLVIVSNQDYKVKSGVFESLVNSSSMDYS